MTSLHIGIAGGGVAGLATAVALRAVGHQVLVFEQAMRYSRVGMTLGLTPNAVKAADGLGIGTVLREKGTQPTWRISRRWDTGEETSRIELGAAADRTYGAPQIGIYRADLLDALTALLPEGVVTTKQRVTDAGTSTRGATMRFEDGSMRHFDAVIGADGIHSVVRNALFGADHLEFTGVVSLRGVVPSHNVSISNPDAITKWWGPHPPIQMHTTPLGQGREQRVSANMAQDKWHAESWWAPGTMEELPPVFREFHPEARALLEACTKVEKTALYVGKPLARWSQDLITLMGDACHPMTPFMGQGAGQALEDAVVLARALEGISANAIVAALVRYENTRKQRATRIQEASRGNKWLKAGGNPDWVYGYDAWNTPLA